MKQPNNINIPKQTQNTIKDAHVIYGNVLTVMEIGLNLQKKNWRKLKDKTR